jgi:hypothetical protein
MTDDLYPMTCDGEAHEWAFETVDGEDGRPVTRVRANCCGRTASLQFGSWVLDPVDESAGDRGRPGIE